MHKRWKIRNTSFQYICQKTKIYTQLVEFTFKHIVSKGMQKSIQHERKVSSRRCYPNMLHDHFIDLPPILGKKVSIKLKNIIYMYIQHNDNNIHHHWFYKKTHTKQYYLKTVQLNKEKSN